MPNVTLMINQQSYTLTDLDPRTTLLDVCRHHLNLTGSKKGCDHGQCGACTMLINGRRINGCLTLAVMHEGDEITTIEGLGSPTSLSDIQQAFVDNDAFQCGYCTPGQICSATALFEEIKQRWPSHVSTDLTDPELIDVQEIAERMSGNICRCSAYPNIIKAIEQVIKARGLNEQISLEQPSMMSGVDHQRSEPNVKPAQIWSPPASNTNRSGAQAQPNETKTRSLGAAL